MWKHVDALRLSVRLWIAVWFDGFGGNVSIQIGNWIPMPHVYDWWTMTKLKSVTFVPCDANGLEGSNTQHTRTHRPFSSLPPQSSRCHRNRRYLSRPLDALIINLVRPDASMTVDITEINEFVWKPIKFSHYRGIDSPFDYLVHFSSGKKPSTGEEKTKGESQRMR